VARFEILIKRSAAKEIEAISRKKDRQRIVGKFGSWLRILGHPAAKRYPDAIATGYGRVPTESSTPSKTTD